MKNILKLKILLRTIKKTIWKFIKISFKIIMIIIIGLMSIGNLWSFMLGIRYAKRGKHVLSNISQEIPIPK